MPTRTYCGKSPVVGEDCYLDEFAIVIGDVRLGDGTSVWPGAIIRGDDSSVEIGAGTAIMDASFVEAPSGHPVKIGPECLISHGARLHGCSTGEGVLVGIGAIVLDGAAIGARSVVAAGSVVTPGTMIPPDCLAMGTPARAVRDITADEISRVSEELKAIGRKAKEYSRPAPTG